MTSASTKRGANRQPDFTPIYTPAVWKEYIVYELPRRSGEQVGILLIKSALMREDNGKTIVVR